MQAFCPQTGYSVVRQALVCDSAALLQLVETALRVLGPLAVASGRVLRALEPSLGGLGGLGVLGGLALMQAGLVLVLLGGCTMLAGLGDGAARPGDDGVVLLAMPGELAGDELALPLDPLPLHRAAARHDAGGDRDDDQDGDDDDDRDHALVVPRRAAFVPHGR